MPEPVEGFIRYWPFALQVEELSGQHCCLVDVPSEHVVEVQSCTAPNVWPDSCAKTCHSVDVRTTTLAAATVSLLSLEEPDMQSWPSHASPTAESVLQVLRRVQYALVSWCWPRHWENRLRRSVMATLSEHPMFHGASALAVEGQLPELTVRFWIPSEMLKVLSYNWEAVLT